MDRSSMIWARRRVLAAWMLALLAALAVLASAPGVGRAATGGHHTGAHHARSHHARRGHGHHRKRRRRREHPAWYVLKRGARCRVDYTREKVTLRVRRHRRWRRVHQLRCVYTGNGRSRGAARPVFPTYLPTAGVSVAVIPTAAADAFAVAADQPLSEPAPGVLANDQGGGLSAQLVSGPSHGTLWLARNGSFSYVPDTGFSGVDSFEYRDNAADGESSGPATATIHVMPLATPAGPYDVAPGATLTIAAPGVLSGDTGSGLHAVLLSAPSHGTLSLNGDGSFSYTPASGFAGADGFTFEAVDSAGQAASPVTVSLEVGAVAPVVVAETFSGAIGNTPLQVGGARGSGPEVYQASSSALAGDSDPNGGTLSTTPATITTAHAGTVVIAADGSFTYTPAPGFAGPSDSFSYQVDTSEGTSATAEATIDFAGRVWYVQASAPAGGDGSSAAPFATLAAAAAAASPSDTIFLYSGSYGGGISLGSDESLVGEPAGLNLDGESLLSPAGGNPVITNTAAGGVGVAMVDGDSLSAVTVSGTAGAGVTVTGAANFTIAASVTISGAGGDGLDVSGGGGAAAVGAAISGSTGHSLVVQNRTGGTLTFDGAISDTGDGLLLESNAGATIEFKGTIAAATTNSHPAFEATGGGTVTSSQDGSTLSATGAAALDVQGTTIGAAGLNFQSISAGSSPTSGPASGIVLSSTGAGTLTVSGSGTTAGSGGTIQGTTVAAVSANDAGGISLSEMDLTDAGGYGVHASAVGSLAVYGTQITGGSSGIVADGSSSTVQPQSFDIESNALSGQQQTAISLAYGGQADGWVQTNTIGSESPVKTGSASADGIDIVPVSGATVEANVANNTVVQVAATGIYADVVSGATLDLTLTQNSVRMDASTSLDGVQISAAGDVCVNPTSNTVTAQGTTSAANGIELDELSGATFDIQALGTTGAQSFLVANNTLAASGGQQAVASAADSPGFASAGSCPTPPSHVHSI